ncbi:LCP family protein [Candidatus Parcubacteria bacterium]|nr:LCP family protein [Patescibacteria group bacterium]MCG2687122.1 LCP family protein [Candidatus Parcubacteria bacterium]
MSDYYPQNNFNYQTRPKNKFWRFFKIVFFIFLVTVIALSIFSYTVIFSHNSVLGGIGRLPVIKQFRQIMGMEKLQGELDDRINFLLLGQGGVGHDGPYLTDTIIFGSLKLSTNDVALISIPRDFYTQIEDNGWLKINTANSIGETNNYPDGGSAYATKILADTFDVPIHYWARIDFNAFEKIINDLNGIKVCLDRGFEDQFYPTDDHEYQTVTFDAGCQMMDGDTALKFARSRHGNNGEGSDFARAARQQKIILALKDKFFSFGTLTSPQKIYNLINTLSGHIQTNIELTEIPHFLKTAQNINPDNIKRLVLDNTTSGLLRDAYTEDGAYVLLPRTGNLNEIRTLIKNIFILKDQSIKPVNVIILNGTKIEGWAMETEGYLQDLGFKVLSTQNSPQQTYEKTVIYKIKDEYNKDALEILKNGLDANVTKFIPEFINKENIENYDKAEFVVVLGSKELPEAVPSEPKNPEEEKIEE